MNYATVVSPWRLITLLFFFAACALALVMRIAFLQVIQHGDFVQRAEASHWEQQTLQAPRGTIKDRDGNALAIALTTWEISLNPSQLKTDKDRDQAVSAVGETLKMSAASIRQKLDNSDGKRPVLIAEKVPYDKGRVLLEKGVWGVSAQERTERSYPEGNLAGVLLGFLGRDGLGLTGIEADYDRELAGVPGTLVFERDVVGAPIPLGYRSTTQSKDGGDLYLTIDRQIQRVVERELQNAVTSQKAEGGSAIVMDPRTGAILAMASRPTFDLLAPNLSDPKSTELFRNRAITDLYEPGSTFKVIIMSSAINEGLVTPETTYMDSGPVIKYGAALNTWDGVHFGRESMTDLLVHSNNVGAVWVSDQLGKDLFYPYIDKFGIGQFTNVGLSGEAQGQVSKPGAENWWPINLATNAFGQGLNATPLQMITAVTAVVNGGTLMRPYIIDRIQTAGVTRTFHPVEVRRVISENTSKQLRDMMKIVSERATPLSQVPGYNVGIKTGTATIPSAGGYEPDATIASIVGFVPYEQPRAVILVKIDRPKNSPWGSQVAAPVFSNIARELLIYWRIPPTEPGKIARVESR